MYPPKNKIWYQQMRCTLQARSSDEEMRTELDKPRPTTMSVTHKACSEKLYKYDKPDLSYLWLYELEQT
jgi:hypothetical protein